jgi:two-component system alkaline phosphatase synthesis response regulator PhoP
MIYYVEDDANIRELVVYTLNQTGLETKGFPDSATFFTAVHEQKPVLVLLDIMLPGENGLEVLKKLRASTATKDLPVIMITAKGAEYDKVVGLDLGADDYVAKPFGMAELVARVKALLRRSGETQSPDHMESGELTVDVKKHTVSVENRPVTLTFKEFSLLACLMESAGRAFTRDQLLELVWGYDYEGGTRTVDVHIQTLRTKLGVSGKRIETIRGVGYRFGEES